MPKTILITGATDGIGRVTANKLASAGHHLLLHGRDAGKLDVVKAELGKLNGVGAVDSYVADLSDMRAVSTFADDVVRDQDRLDVLINNAGILKTQDTITADGLDIRFAVNTLAPYLLARKLAPLIGPMGRIINLSSAAQAPVSLDAMTGGVVLTAMEAYSQSKLAITMWSRGFADSPDSPIVIAVNPGSLLGSKMVKEGFGIDGGDLSIGADILCRAALADEFATRSGEYFDNDSGQFAQPHADALDKDKAEGLMQAMDDMIAKLSD